jgi:hypothetical protein
MFKHIAILVPVVAKSFHAKAEWTNEMKKASVQHCIKIIAV